MSVDQSRFVHLHAIERCSEELRVLGRELEVLDPEPGPLHGYVREPTAHWVVQQLEGGVPLPGNAATVLALRRALDELQVFRPAGTLGE